mgnify:CR=1 FL=1
MIPLYLQVIIAICTLSVSAGIAFAQFKKGSRTESGDIIKFYKDQAENYKIISDTTRKEYTEKHETLLKEVGILRGELNTERTLRIQYENVLKDKNPETETFMLFVTNSLKDQQVMNKEIATILKEIHIMAKAEHERDYQVNTTVKKI